MKWAVPLLFLAAAAAAVETAAFSAGSPAGWSVEKTSSTATYLRPPEKDAAAATIVLAYDAPSEGRPADAAAYVARSLAPDSLFGLPSDFARGKDMDVAGRPSAVLTRRVASTSRHADRQEMAETVVVVPAAKGYYVLTLHGPASRSARDGSAFRALLKTFKPAGAAKR